MGANRPSAGDKDDKRRHEADQRTARDVARIVQADKNPRHSDEGGCGEEEGTRPAAADKHDGESNRESSDRMVTREGWFLRGSPEDDRSARMRNVRTFPCPEVRNDLAREQSHAPLP